MKSRAKIYVTRQIPQAAFDILLGECDISFWNSVEPVPRGELLNNIRGVGALLCMPTDKVDTEVLDRAGPSLKVIGTLSERCDHIDVAECERRNIKVIYMSPVPTDIVADLTVDTLQKQLSQVHQQYTEDVNQNVEKSVNDEVNKGDITLMFKGKTLGLIGLGNTALTIGQHLRTRGISKIIYNDFTQKSKETEIGAEFEDFDRVLKESDIICICCQESAKNRDLFYKDAFKKMKASAILIEAGRGHVINYFDLYEALREQRIGAAAVDLREQGKIPYKDQLLGLNNCIFVPFQESNRWDKRKNTSSILANKIIAALNSSVVPEAGAVSG